MRQEARTKKEPCRRRKHLSVKLSKVIRHMKPGPRAWRGAVLGGLIVFIAVLITAAVGLFGAGGPIQVIIGFAFLFATFALVGGLLTLLWILVRGLSPFYTWVAAAVFLTTVFMTLTGMSVAIGILLGGLGAAVAASLLGAGLATLAGSRWRETSRLRKGMALAGITCGAGLLIAGGLWFLGDGTERTTASAVFTTDAPLPQPLDLPNPSDPGAYAVRTLVYGSGEDKHREIYGAGVDLVTESVDGSGLVEGWSGLRTAYWGFGPEALPRNARVWYPDGDGPFPLVLILHGQHPMLEDSEPGYAYLGELLAGRGYIVASVDENFLNLSPVVDLLILSGLKEENDLRGWLLLEHLSLWRDWAATPDHLFHDKVDMDAIALIGHSRGGEAVAIAAALNRLDVYPDDATIAFDYDFGIRSVIAFAPVYGMYRPAGQSIELEDLNYLVLHGAHDMDVFTFQGSSQYAQTHLTPESDTFKAGLYIYGANHGQFNTVWGRKDLFEPVMRAFNLAQLMPGEDQRQVAKTAVSAFLDATLKDEAGYRAFFQNPRRAATWLPEAMILGQYQDAETTLISTYEEDIDLTTTTLQNGETRGEELTVWREAALDAKWQTHENQVAVLGWSAPSGTDYAAYTVTLPPTDRVSTEDTTFVFEAADAGELGEPHSSDAAPSPIDFTIEVIDGDGDVGRLPLSEVAPLHPQVEVELGKAGFFSPFPSSEPVLQHFEVPLTAFAATNPALDVATLTRIRFVFDRTATGSIVLDNVGLRTP